MTTGAFAQDINFGIISTEASQNLKQDWQPLIDDMSRQTGLKVNAFFAPDYAGIIEGMRFNKVQVGWFGNKSAMEAVDRASGEVFAQMVNADGTQGYYSHLIVHKDSPLNTLDDVIKNGKSLSFGNGDPNSTSGFLVPSYYVFAQNKVDAKTLFKLTRSANHETNALAVANKQVDVATNNSENLEKLEGAFAGEVQGDQDRLDFAADPARPAGVAQGPARGDQGEAEELLLQLRQDRRAREGDRHEDLQARRASRSRATSS